MDSEAFLEEAKKQISTQHAIENAKELVDVRIITPCPSGLKPAIARDLTLSSHTENQQALLREMRA